jgi:glycerol uptake facilitator-like aquaporin
VTNPQQAPFAIGFSLMAIVFAFGYFSGGHFNPAVSLGVMMIGGMSQKKALTYAAVQFLAGFLGALYAVMMHGQLDNDFIAPMPSDESAYGILRAIAAEVLITFFLVTVVLQVLRLPISALIPSMLPLAFILNKFYVSALIISHQVACSRQKDNQFYGFAIGMTVLSGAMSVGNISGGAFNPAVSTGLQLAKCCVTGHCRAFSYIWLYWLSHFGAAAIAAGCFLIIHPKSGIKQHTGADDSSDARASVLPSASRTSIVSMPLVKATVEREPPIADRTT